MVWTTGATNDHGMTVVVVQRNKDQGDAERRRALALAVVEDVLAEALPRIPTMDGRDAFYEALTGPMPLSMEESILLRFRFDLSMVGHGRLVFPRYGRHWHAYLPYGGPWSEKEKDDD